MRVGDVGSISSAGDLMAFSIAMMLTLAVLISFDNEDYDEDTFRSDELLEELLEWEFLDHDSNGILNMISKERLSNASSIGIDDDIGVILRSDHQEFSFLVVDGLVVSNQTIHSIHSPVRSLTVIFEDAGEYNFGTISVFRIEVES